MKDTFAEALAWLAAQEGSSEAEILAQMQAAIDAACAHSDPQVRARWAAMPFQDAPTPAALIAYLAAQHKI